MKPYFVTNTIAVNLDFVQRTFSNGKSGDKRIVICFAPCVNDDMQGESICFVEINGDPIFVGINDNWEDNVQIDLIFQMFREKGIDFDTVGAYPVVVNPNVMSLSYAYAEWLKENS
jgi:hypothetical protein